MNDAQPSPAYGGWVRPDPSDGPDPSVFSPPYTSGYVPSATAETEHHSIEMTGPYGQNTEASQQDRERLQNQQQQQQQTMRQPMTDPYYVAGQVTIPPIPPELVVGSTEDWIIAEPYHNGLVMMNVILIIAFVVLLINLVVTQSVEIIVVFVIVTVALLSGLWFTVQRKVVFRKQSRQMCIVSRRLLLHLCGDMVEREFAFDELRRAAFDGDLRAGIGDIFVDTAEGTQVTVSRRFYGRASDIQADIIAWQSYVAGLRGVPLESLLATEMSRHQV